MMLNYYILRCFCASRQKMFPDESTRLVFYRMLEKHVMQKMQVFAWSLTDFEALCLTVTNEELAEIRENAGMLIKAYNYQRRQRDISLHQKPESEIMRVAATGEALCRAVVAMHCWPLLCGLGSNFVEYPWTSYLLILGKKHPHLQSGTVLKWFENKQKFRYEHLKMLEKNKFLKNEFEDNFFKFMEEKKKV